MGSERTLADKLQVLDQKQECWVARETGATSKIKAPKNTAGFLQTSEKQLEKKRKKKARPPTCF